MGVQRASFKGFNCSIAQCLELVGEWWTFLILRDAFLGVSRFDEFRERLGIAATRLTSGSLGWSRRALSGEWRTAITRRATTTS